MTIIAVKKEKNKITIGSDTQLSYGMEISYGKKLFEVGQIVFGGAGYLSELQIMKRFLIDNGYEEKTIKSESELFNLFSNFLKYLKEKGVMDERESYLKTIFSSFLIVVKNLGKVYEYNLWALIEIENFKCIGCGREYAISILDETGSVEKALNYAKKYNNGCGGENNIIEIKI